MYRKDKDRFLLYSSGNCIQYPMINHNGKEYEKECVYICICIKLSHFVIHSSSEHNIVSQLYFN